jgi:hypothetical protein
MPAREHVRGMGVKERREYEHIMELGEESGRNGKRAEEAPARTVRKGHQHAGHQKGR